MIREHGLHNLHVEYNVTCDRYKSGIMILQCVSLSYVWRVIDSIKKINVCMFNRERESQYITFRITFIYRIFGNMIIV